MVYWCFTSNFTGILASKCVLALYMQPLVCGTGCMLNLVCAFIFSSASWLCGYSKKLTMRPFLIALTLYDALQLILSIFLIVLPGMKEFFNATDSAEKEIIAHLHVISVYSIGLLYPWLLSANYASIWTITVISIQRYFAICHPLLSRHRFHILRRYKLIIACVTGVAISLNLIRYGEHKWVMMPNSTEINLERTNLMKSKVYLWLNDGILYPCLVFLFPFVVLAVMNWHIIAAIKGIKFPQESDKRSSCQSGSPSPNMKESSGPLLNIQSRRSLFRRSRDSSGISILHEQREHRSAMMVLAVVVLFFFCHTLTVALRWWELADPEFFTVAPDRPGQLLLELSNLLVNLSSAMNPFIYFFFTRMFRDLWMEIRQGPRHRNSRVSLNLH